MHRANETRPLLEQLRRLAEQYQCAILCVRHPAKPGGGGGGKAIHRGLDSVDFIGAARTGLFVEQHPLDEGKVLLTQSKSNLGPLGRTQVFTKYQGQFEWCGISRLRAELLAGSGRGPDLHVFLEAVCWLEARLEGGVPLLATTVQAEAEEEGVNSATLRRAKKALGVRSTKQGEVWYWQLPGLVGLAPPASVLPHAPLGQHDPLEHLPEYQRDASTLPATDGQAAPDVVATQGGDATAIESSGLSVEPVENMEGVQEAQGQHVGHETDASRTASTSMPCPHCRRATTWVLRGGIPFCYKCHTRAPRGR